MMSGPKAVNFFSRRARNLTLTLVLVSVVGLIVYAQNQSLGHGSFTSGYILFGTIVFLAAFNLRKRLSFLPAIGTAKFWMQLHIYLGLATFAFFAFHIGWRIPDGRFEIFLAALYLIVAFSGIYGLYATRVFPQKLTSSGEEVIFERIPTRRQQIAAQARRLVIEACESSDVLAKFYSNRLCYFFERPPALGYLVKPNARSKNQLISEIEGLDRYLGTEQRVVRQQLTSMIRQRDNLDFHHALQGRLKLWLFLHIGLTYSLLLVGLLHGLMAHSFFGGLQ